MPLRNNESMKINGGWQCPRVEYEYKNKNEMENDSGNGAEWDKWGGCGCPVR